MTSDAHGPVLSVMLVVPDAAAVARWYAKALGATELWNLGGVVGLTVEGAPFFRRALGLLHERLEAGLPA
jgi:catechol 2,3-dioxygenase-like lactoylglutathione lyase family enzyme